MNRWWLHPYSGFEDATDPSLDEQWRERLVRVACLLLMPVGVIYSFLRWKNQGTSDVTFWLFAVGTGTLVFAYLLLRKTSRSRLAGTILCCDIAIMVTLIALFNGGFDAPALYWLPVIPLIAALTIHSLASLLSAAYCAFLVVTLFVLKQQHVELPSQLTGLMFEVVKMVTMVAVVLFLSGISLYYEYHRRRAQRLASEALQSLQEANFHLTLARDDANEASRAKSAFLANVSHEIRTPMNGIVGMLTLLEQSELSAEQSDYAETARRSAEQLLHILQDILDVSQMEAGKLTLLLAPFHLYEEVEQVLSILKTEAEKKGLFVKSLIAPGTPRLLMGDAIRLRQVLTNLVLNSIKFTHEGGVQVYITREQRSMAGREWIRFDVEDSGIGIEQGVMEQLFLPFCQGDDSSTREYGGTGLGLTIARDLVERMGGTLDVESRVGEGSLFTFSLPFSTPAETDET